MRFADPDSHATLRLCSHYATTAVVTCSIRGGSWARSDASCWTGPGRESSASICRTTIRSNTRTLTRLGILVETISKFLRELATCRLLARVLGEQCEVDEGTSRVCVEDPAKAPSDSVQNPADPDASCNAHRGRAGIEGTISRLKHQMGLANVRVRGMMAVSYAVLLRALGLNIRRVAAFVQAN